MNKKIKLLAEQANIDYDLRPEIARAPVWIGTDEELEKFAELIILECADIAGDDWDTAGRAILKHFEVNR
jgi:hypothetical protein